jgi:hypothetical protein
MRVSNFIFSLILISASVVFGQPKPITKQGLIDALRIGGVTQTELAHFVKQRGVDFQMTAKDDTDLRAVGATQELIGVVRVSYRGNRAAPPRAAKVPQAPRQDAPVAPPVPPPAAPSPEPAPAPEPPPVPPPPRADPPPPPREKPAPVPRAKAANPTVNSLAEVRRIFVEDMPENLDDYIRAEIHKQLKGRLEVVLRVEEADAIMTGVSDQKSGTGAAITGRYLGLHDNATGSVSIVDRNKAKVLWAEEAGDRSLLLGAFKRGGPRKVADRLVGKLKKVL